MNPLLFTEPAFLFVFAPVVLTFYHLLPYGVRNGFLLAVSLFLYTWGEGSNVLVLLGSTAIAYTCGLWVARGSRAGLWVGVGANVVLLVVFKYAAFLTANINSLLARLGGHPLPIPKIHSPAGMSFTVFIAIAYLVDIYRRDAREERNPFAFALFAAMFPHIVAGPILRFGAIREQLYSRKIDSADVAMGIRRFVIGLGKKVLLSDTLAATADRAFALPTGELSASVAWLGAICYTLQIYLDFSGYSDMAIGLAAMLGIRFPENFNYPYIAKSIADFWRRWHITLSTWLRDYLFFPLGVRGGRWKLYRNTLIVFLICGLWHGPAWTFVCWGLFHGILLVIERLGLLDWTKRSSAAQHAYTLLAVLCGWVLFRSHDLASAGGYYAAMLGFGSPRPASPGFQSYLPLDVQIALIASILASMPLRNWSGLTPNRVSLPQIAALTAVFVLALCVIAAGTYSPFLYFQF